MTRELNGRPSDDIDDRLLWHQHDGRVSVSVVDTKTGQAFELPGATARDRSTSSTTPTPTRLGAAPDTRGHASRLGEWRSCASPMSFGDGPRLT